MITEFTLGSNIDQSCSFAVNLDDMMRQDRYGNV